MGVDSLHGVFATEDAEMVQSFRRDLLRGSLDLMVLSVLVDGSKYGYLIQRHIRDASGGKVDLQAGTMYPILHRLEAEQLIQSRWDESAGRSRKWYDITTQGRACLREQAAEWTEFASCIERLLQVLRPIVPGPASALTQAHT